MAYLIQKRSDGTLVQQWQLEDGPLVVGRGKGVDVRIDDPEMSKLHFLIEHKNGKYFVRDLKSSNGTWINKQQVAEVDLKPGDEICAGQTRFVFEKGLLTVIADMAQGGKGHKTVLREVTKAVGPPPHRR